MCLRYKCFLKTLWESEKLFITNNFSFSHNILYPFGELLPFLSNLKLPSPKPWFLCVYSTSVLKTLWEKEKLFITNKFSFFSECRLQTPSMWKSPKFVVWVWIKILIPRLFLFNSLSNDKILALSKLKAFADNKLNVAKIMIYVSFRVTTL